MICSLWLDSVFANVVVLGSDLTVYRYKKAASVVVKWHNSFDLNTNDF